MKYFSLDVECARGLNNECVPIAIALVNEQEEVLLSSLIQPEVPIADYVTQVHGIKEADVSKAPTLQIILAALGQLLPPYAVLVGQSIDRDIEYLQLVKGVHFADSVDISLFFALTYASGERPRRFTLHQEVQYLLEDIDYQPHNPVEDAKYSMRLYLKYCNNPKEQEKARNTLIKKVFKDPNAPKFSPDSSPTTQRFASDMCDAVARMKLEKKIVRKVFKAYLSHLELQYNVIDIVGRPDQIRSKILIAGKSTEARHLLTVQPVSRTNLQNVLCMNSYGLVPVHHFSFDKVDPASCRDGFVRGAFEGSFVAINAAITSLQLKRRDALTAGLKIQLRLYLVIDQATAYADNADNSLKISFLNSNRKQKHKFPTAVKKLAEIFPEMRPPASNSKLEWDAWLQKLKLKRKELKDDWKNFQSSAGLTSNAPAGASVNS